MFSRNINLFVFATEIIMFGIDKVIIFFVTDFYLSLAMQTYSQTIQIRWADIDANRHLRHSVYYDYGAAMRMNVLSERGLTTKKLEELMMGPILFREEA